MECFTANFLQFFTEKHVKIRFLAGRFGIVINASILGIFLKFPNSQQS